MAGIGWVKAQRQGSMWHIHFWVQGDAGSPGRGVGEEVPLSPSACPWGDGQVVRGRDEALWKGSLSPCWVPLPRRCTLSATCPLGSLRRRGTKRGSGRAPTSSTLKWSGSIIESLQGSSSGTTTPTAFGCSMMMQVPNLEGHGQTNALFPSPASQLHSLLKGVPISVMFLTPGVTPWKTTLPGVANGANNPAIRLFEYDRDTLSLQVRSLGSAGARGGGRRDLIIPLPSLADPPSTDH